jgi:amino acid transporter
MFERFKRNGAADEPHTRTGSVATAERGRTVDDGATATRVEPRDRPATGTMQDVRARQREVHGGLNGGAAFFGWLVAVGVAVLLTGILAAAGAAIGLTEPSTASDAQSQSPETLSLAGAIALLVVLGIAYYCGGYVAGRMSRFNGPRQGLGVWLIGLIVTVVLAVAGVLLGAKYNVLSQLNLPRIPVDEGSLTAGGLIALVAIVAITLLAAMAGGKQGTHYHRKIDKTGGIL